MTTETLEITIRDDAGNIVINETVEAQTATEDEINQMVSLIDGGMPAHMAASLIRPTTTPPGDPSKT